MNKHGCHFCWSKRSNLLFNFFRIASFKNARTVVNFSGFLFIAVINFLAPKLSRIVLCNPRSTSNRIILEPQFTLRTKHFKVFNRSVPSFALTMSHDTEKTKPSAQSIFLCVWSRDSNWSRVSHVYHMVPSFLSRILANVATTRGTPDVLWKPLLHVSKVTAMTASLAPHVRTFHHQVAIMRRKKLKKKTLLLDTCTSLFLDHFLQSKNFILRVTSLTSFNSIILGMSKFACLCPWP